MSLGNALIEQVIQMAGAEAPLSVTVSRDGRTASAILLHWSPLAVSVQEINLSGGPQLSDLKENAAELAARLTYLSEPICVLELDGLAREAQLRSSPPKAIPDGVEYFELRLAQNGVATLRRYRQEGGDTRVEIPAIMTLETLGRVVDDLATP